MKENSNIGLNVNRNLRLRKNLNKQDFIQSESLKNIFYCYVETIEKYKEQLLHLIVVIKGKLHTRNII